MATSQPEEIIKSLVAASQSWAAGKKFDADNATELRQAAIHNNHRHYLENIQIYRNLAASVITSKEPGIEDIKKNLMFDAGIFKSYEQGWLDNGNYNLMTHWLSSLFHRPIDGDFSDIKTIDEWIDCLATHGVQVTYSSGTSGNFSFVPREHKNWIMAKTANISCLAPQLLRHSAGLSRYLCLPMRMLAPDIFSKWISRSGLHGYDAAFLGFRSGGMGNQVLFRELAPLFRRCHYLFDISVSGSALRNLRRGRQNTSEDPTTHQLLDQIQTRKEQNYLNLIKNVTQSVQDGQKIFIFGAPFQIKEMCSIIHASAGRLPLGKGSLVLLGGGWKSFSGEAVSREELIVSLISAFDIPPHMILEGYSMTETNTLMLRCPYGRFHMPPLLEPVILDEALNPQEGSNLTGTFGFLDAMALTYPGFNISGDYVNMIDGACDCGLTGPAILHIERISGTEIKGCGGIMSSFQV